MIKKLPALLLALFIGCSNTYAQKFNAANIHWGINAGINFSSFTDDVGPFDKQSPGYKNSPYSYYEKYVRITARAGVTAEYSITPRFSVGAELQYTGRGAAYRVENGNVVLVNTTSGRSEKAYDYYKFKIDNIELPLLAEYNVLKPSSLNAFVLYGGVAPGITVNTGTSYVYYVPTGSSPTDVGTTSKDRDLDGIRGFNISPIVGLKFGGNKPKGANFYFDLRFEYAVLPTFTHSSVNGYNLQTNMWTAGFGLGVRF